MNRPTLALAALCLPLFALAPVRAQSDEIKAKLRPVIAQEDSPAKLTAFASVMSSEAPTGRDGRFVRELYRETLFHLYASADKRQQILDAFQVIIDATPEDDRDFAAREAAAALTVKTLLPQDAEIYAKQALALSDKSQEQQLNSFKNNQIRTRSGFLTTLGISYLRVGQLKIAHDTLAQAFAIDPLLDDAALGLSQLSEAAGNMPEAIDYLVPDVISGTATDEIKARLETLYKTSHKNSLAGLDDMLDAAYLRDQDSVIKVTRYDGPTLPSPHTALVELFGSATCGPCVAADIATDAQLKRYSSASALLLVYHENVPRPDPMTSGETDARGDFYGVSATPTVFLDGQEITQMGGERSDAVAVFNKLRDRIDYTLKTSTSARLLLTGTGAGGNVSGQVTIAGLADSSDRIVLQIALVENRVRYVGSNGVRFHPMVVRDLANEGEGFVYKGTPNEVVRFSFDLNARNRDLATYLAGVEKSADKPFVFDNQALPVNPRQLSVVAFLQNTRTKEILQSTLLTLR